MFTGSHRCAIENNQQNIFCSYKTKNWEKIKRAELDDLISFDNMTFFLISFLLVFWTCTGPDGTQASAELTQTI